MTTGDEMRDLAARLMATVGPGPKPKLSIPNQVRIDALLYDVGEMVRKLLTENGLHDQWAPECTREQPDAPLMAATEHKRRADELANKVYYALIDVRHALCWDSIPPTTHISDDQRARIQDRRYYDPTATVPPADQDGADA